MRVRHSKLFCAVAHTALITGATFFAGTAQAQSTPQSAPQSLPEQGASDGAGAPGDAIVVTGTLIKRPDLKSNSPQTVVGSDEFRYQGATTVEQVLNRLPQFTADANENVSNGSDGTSNINLRNLGSNRVLVLLDGERMMPSQAMDLNFVPGSLIERVDVMTGGASAVYGSDAISGVVNFVLKKNLDGVRVDMQTGFAQHDNGNTAMRNLVSSSGYNTAPGSVLDGGKQDITVSAGKNFASGRGNITVYGGYRSFSPVRQSTRDVSSCAIQDRNNGSQLYCGGSSNSPYGSFVPLSDLSAYKGQTLVNSRANDGTLVPYNSSYAYNYAPNNYFQRSDERITAGAFGHFEISRAAEIYGSFMYMHDRTFSQVAPSAIWLGTAFAISCNNPYASANQLQAICGSAAGTNTTQDALAAYRTDIAPRRDDLRHNDFRYSAGVRGDIGSGFSYDVNYMYSLVRYDETYLNDVDQVKAGRALNAISVNGVPTCRSVLDGTDPSCVPANIFQPHGLTAAQGAYLFGQSNTASRNSLSVIQGTLSGDLGKLGIIMPWTSKGLGMALGVDHRRETLAFTADAVAQQNGTTNSDGVISVTEVFGELEVPLVEDMPLLRSLSVNGGFRYSSYDNKQQSTGYGSGFNVWTYKAELSWQPVNDLRVRASYNHAIRAPNVAELFASQSVGNVNGIDPCAGPTPSASLATCAVTGVTAAQYGHIVECPSDTCSALSGGNRALKPETANTYTAGIVFTPKFLRRFSLSVDYYNIKVKDYISSMAPSLIMGQCAQTGDPYFCGLFKRDARSGALFGQNAGYVISTTMNTGYLKTSGLDFNADYTVGLGKAGSLNMNLVGTYLLNQIAQPVPGLGSYDCNGLFGYTCGQPSPTWRHVARFTWMTPTDTVLSLSWRHIGGTRLSSLTDNPLLSAPQTFVNSKINAYNYFDLSLTQTINKKLTLRAGVNNLFDKDPPLLAAGLLQLFGNGNTYPGVYDALGRTIFVGATVNF